MTPDEMLAKADRFAEEVERYLPSGKLSTTEMLAVRMQLADYWSTRAYEAALPHSRTDLDKVREWASEYGWKVNRWKVPEGVSAPNMWELYKPDHSFWIAAFDLIQNDFQGAAHLTTPQGVWLINDLGDFLEELED